MAGWMVCALAPGLALCGAAALADHAARQRRWPGRWIWLCAMLGSIVLPFAGPLLPQFALFRATSIVPFAPGRAAAIAPPDAGLLPPDSVALALGLWIASSLLVLALLLASAWMLRHRARGWQHASVEGRETYIAPQAGPAVFGWWRPSMVLPQWLAQAPSQLRELAIAHERSHLDARDPQLLAVALALLVVMPWNPSIWWQLRRLRHAIEVDCDTRVLRGGHDVLDYGEALLALGLRRSRQHGLLAASDASKSLLERRIRIMSTQPQRWSRLTAAALVGVALCAAAVAAELAPAHATAAAPTPPLAQLPTPPPLPTLAPLPSAPAAPPAPPLPALAAVASPDVVVDAPEPAAEPEAESDKVQAAKAEAEEAAERAAELKKDAEEAEKAAQEAKRDAEEQQAQAESAKREAEAAEAEAKARKQDAEAAARNAKASPRVN
ncbi:MAG: M56 family metallopeptidase [Proteobacteria bacterium]|nr:M56 family metallopeptidase [Pseudomonadota bacterium]